MRRSIQGMLEELEYNLWEHILSRLVDYGHAFSPEIEMAALQGDEALLLHGEAVNIDMALTTQVYPPVLPVMLTLCVSQLLWLSCFNGLAQLLMYAQMYAYRCNGYAVGLGCST